MLQAFDARLQQSADEVRARDIQVGEVGRVGLVQVVVAFVERAVGGGDYGEEERRGREGGRDSRFAEEAMA